jgi:hypothetical protein
MIGERGRLTKVKQHEKKHEGKSFDETHVAVLKRLDSSSSAQTPLPLTPAETPQETPSNNTQSSLKSSKIFPKLLESPRSSEEKEEENKGIETELFTRFQSTYKRIYGKDYQGSDNILDLIRQVKKSRLYPMSGNNIKTAFQEAFKIELDSSQPDLNIYNELIQLHQKEKSASVKSICSPNGS